MNVPFAELESENVHGTVLEGRMRGGLTVSITQRKLGGGEEEEEREGVAVIAFVYASRN